MVDDVKEIEEIIFGVFSPKEIVDMSVCKVENTKLTGPGSVYDERMGGNTDNNIPCVTCGHFGHIEFNEYIIHPLFYKQVVAFLRCFCIQCNRLLITSDQVAVCGLMRYAQERRFKKIMDKLEKVDICCHCSSLQPKITYSVTDNTIAKLYKEKVADEKNEESDDENTTKKVGKKKDTKISIVLTVDEIKKSLDAITDEDVILCGFDPTRIHPRNFVLSVFPVIPSCARPFVLADGHICDDDLTNQYLEIIKANNVLKPDEDVIPDEKRETKKQKALQSLKFRVLTLFNNSQSKAKHPTNGRPIKGLKERMTGKEGQIRNNLMGKRVEFSGRTVIGPDPKLRFGEMGMPRHIAEDLTIPEQVTVFNKDYLSVCDVSQRDRSFVW
jgi:DNA-directed RNA polymerase beta' subunit